MSIKIDFFLFIRHYFRQIIPKRMIPIIVDFKNRSYYYEFDTFDAIFALPNEEKQDIIGIDCSKTEELQPFSELRSIPKKLYTLANLESFDCSGNFIEELPKGISKLTKLKYLNISNNKIRKIPTEIGDLIGLEEFFSFDNKIEEIPIEILNCRNLKIMYLGNRYTMHIPIQVQRFMDRINNRLYATTLVYSDNENVHNSKITMSVRESLSKILVKNILDYNELSKICF